MMEKKFELPYNFNLDGEYFTFLDNLGEKKNCLDCIYLPCFSENGEQLNTREELIGAHIPKTWGEYTDHITRLKAYGVPISLLCQRNATLELIETHINKFDIHDFIINDDSLALKLKEKYGDKIFLRLSITRKVTSEELETEDFSMYDNICLFFWYNRHLDVLKKLPKQYSYAIIVNTYCLYNCSAVEHWFAKRRFMPPCMCGKYYKFKLNFPKIAYIRPEDLNYFDNYVSVYKLEGREFKTNQISEALEKYMTREKEDIETTHEKYNDFIFDNVEENYRLKD